MKFYKLVNKNWIETGSISRDYMFDNIDAIAYKLGYVRIYSLQTKRLTYNYYYMADCAKAKSATLGGLYSRRNRYLYSIDDNNPDADYVYFSYNQTTFDALTNDELKSKYGLMRCDDCGELRYYNDVIKVGRNHVYCRTCINNHATRCYVCGRWYMKKSLFTAYNLLECGDTPIHVCNNCKSQFEREIATCADCGGITRSFTIIRGNHYCGRCAPGHDVPNLICGYHDGVLEIEPQFATTETPAFDAFYGGAEIETECHNTQPRFVAYDINTVMNAEKKLCKFERDGSLERGVEIITQPGTLDWYYENTCKFQKLFSILNDNKCSYKNSSGHDTCGLHIHINRSFFKDYDYENRLCYLFQRLQSQIRVLSQRRNFDYCHFAPGVVSWREIFNQKNAYMHGHGTALNVSNRNTIEFRIYRGTTDYATFMAYLEFTRNIATLVRDTTDISKIEDTTFTDVVNYCDNKYLNDFCIKLGLLEGGAQ